MEAANKQVVKIQPRKVVVVNRNKPGDKPVNEYIAKKPQQKPNFKKQQPQQQKPKNSVIKKRTGLKPKPIQEYKDKRMYRLSIIFGSTVVADTFIIDVPFATSMVTFRDKLLASYQDLLKLLDKQVRSSMLPKPYTKILETTDKGIVEGANKDIVHKITTELYTPTTNPQDLCFNSVVSCTIVPGHAIKGITKRIIVRVNHVNNPNFSPKKAKKAETKQTTDKKRAPKKIVIKKK